MIEARASWDFSFGLQEAVFEFEELAKALKAVPYFRDCRMELQIQPLRWVQAFRGPIPLSEAAFMFLVVFPCLFAISEFFLILCE